MVSTKSISVVIPARNAGRTISRTLASLISNALYIKEVIVVDDHSEDDLEKAVNKFKKLLPKLQIVRSVGTQNPGVARLTGLLMASGEWITFVDADDCLTPSSLRYVSKLLTDKVVLLHAKTIYYESGIFDQDNIEYSDESCGGNFYRRQYLLDHDLVPHINLPLCEDEYFNRIVSKYINLFDDPETRIARYDYPVYEVHHDIEDGKSYAMSNWEDYLIKYHLLCEKCVADFFHGWKDELEEEYLDNFIFCYYLLQGLALDQGDEIDLKKCLLCFKDAADYYKEHFQKTSDDIINYYHAHDGLDVLKSGAVASTGVEFDEYFNFDEFVEGLE